MPSGIKAPKVVSAGGTLWLGTLPVGTYQIVVTGTGLKNISASLYDASISAGVSGSLTGTSTSVSGSITIPSTYAEWGVTVWRPSGDTSAWTITKIRVYK